MRTVNQFDEQLIRPMISPKIVNIYERRYLGKLFMSHLWFDPIIRFLHTKTVNKQQRNGAIIFCSFCGGKKGTVLPASGKVENEILKRGNKQKSLSVVTLICILLQ